MNRSLPWLLESFASDAGPSVSLRSHGAAWSPQLLHARALQWAAFLTAVGVRRGDRVVLCLRKSFEEIGLTFAIAQVGAIFVNVHPSNRVQQVQHILQDCGAHVLISSQELLRRLGPALADVHLPHLVVVDDAEGLTVSGHVHHLSDADALSPRDRLAPSRLIEADIAAILYTSGSTGSPKGIIQTHGNLVEGAEIVSHYVQNTAEDTILSVLPFSFDYGLNQLLSAMWSRCSLVLQDYLFPRDIVTTLKEEQITGMAGVPTIWVDLLSILEHDRALSLPHLRYITNSGGKLNPGTVRRLRERLPDVDVYLMYGLTEAFRSTYLPPAEIDKRSDSIGKAVPNVAVHVIDTEEGRECEPNEVGELVHRGALIAKGYWGDPEATARVFRPNPLLPEASRNTEMVVYSGDLVRRDEDGYLYYVGRRDRMLKCSGHRISPDEISEVLMKMDGVRQAAVIGIDNERLGQQIVAVVELVPGIETSEAACRAFVSRFLPSHMVPAVFRFTARLPRTANGKLDFTAMSAALGAE